MKKLTLILLLALTTFGISFAKETSLTKRQVSSQALVNMMDSDFKDCAEIDEDGDILMEYDGLTFYVFINYDLNLICFSASWGGAEDLDSDIAAEICNDWNKDYVFTSCYYSDYGSFRMQYYMTFEGGLGQTTFNESMDMFCELSFLFWDYLSESDAL